VQKREWRKLWIQRVNAGVRQYGISYSQFIPALEKSNVQLNRKVLAALAAQEPFSFKAVVDVVKQQSKL
jgi:large subunit ribosomal protein L20